MSRKRDKIKRRRQLAKATGSAKRSSKKGSSQARSAKSNDSPPTMDIWIAVGVVVGVIGLLVALYFFAVRRPSHDIDPTVEVNVSTPAIESEPQPTEGVVTLQQSPVPEPKRMSWTEPPEMTLDADVDYRAVIKTEKGDIDIDLYEAKTPVTVNNFVFLARQGYYDGVIFHRVIPGFMAQTGDPTGTGTGGPGYSFRDEFDPELRHDGAGVVSMANTGRPGTNGSQFFITYGPQLHLDDAHTVFGKVVEGMDVVEQLTAQRPSDDPDAPSGDRIITIEIIEG